jgi:gliding motility-associated-like protein
MIKKFLTSVIVFLLVPVITTFAQDINVSADESAGCESLTVTFTATSASILDGTFLWIFENGAVSVSDDEVITHTYSSPIRDRVVTIYTPLNATEPSDSAETEIIVYPIPDANFYQQTDDLLSYSMTLTNDVQFEESITNRNWTVTTDTFGTEVSYTDRIVNPTYAGSGSYPATLIVSLDGLPQCADTVTHDVFVADTLLIPNVFTPNDDRINDVFYIRSDGITNLNFVVYTRYGFQVFKFSSPNIQWDGRSSAGIKLKTGVYYYVLSSDDGNPTYNRAGYIHLFSDDAPSGSNP